MSTSATLYRAADLIAQSGLWKQGPAPILGPMPHCTLTAISSAATNALDRTASVDAVYDYLGVLSVTAWNDAPDRTAAEVVSMLRTVAAEQEVTGQAERITSAAAESVTL